MKTLFITLSEPSVVKNILATPFFEDLKKLDVEIYLLTTPHQLPTFAPMFDCENVKTISLNIASSGILHKLLKFCAMHGFISGTKQVMEKREHSAGRTKIHPKIKYVFGIIFGRSNIYKKIIRFFELHTRPIKDIEKIFDTYHPDVVFSTMLINADFDIEIQKEARRRKVKLIATTRGWDNFSSYGFMRVLPDHLIVSSEFLKKMAIEMQGVPSDKISVLGLPHYDLFSNPKIIISKKEFFEKNNLDIKKRLITYFAIGDFLFPTESGIAEKLNTLIESGTVESSHAVFRAHPDFISTIEKIKHLSNVTLDEARKYSNADLIQNTNVIHFINLLYHSDCVITAGSTILIDAQAFDKPVITIAFDGATEDSHLMSVRRFYEKFHHIKHLVKTRGLLIANSKEEMASHINLVLNNPTILKEERQEMKKVFLGNFDGKNSKRYLDFFKNIL